MRAIADGPAQHRCHDERAAAPGRNDEGPLASDRCLPDSHVSREAQLLRWTLSLALWLVSLLATGCAVLPDGLAGPPAKAIPASSETTLGRIARAASPDPDLSGFRLMPSGDFALGTRLELARRAERSLDVQYYHIENDDTGRYFLRTLRDAARRDVRVRLLMDYLWLKAVYTF